jgi:hypothetical protein
MKMEIASLRGHRPRRSRRVAAYSGSPWLERGFFRPESKMAGLPRGCVEKTSLPLAVGSHHVDAISILVTAEKRDALPVT